MCSDKLKFLDDLVSLIETTNNIDEIKTFAKKYVSKENDKFNPEETKKKMDAMEKLLMTFDKNDLVNYIVVKTYLSDNDF